MLPPDAIFFFKSQGVRRIEAIRGNGEAGRSDLDLLVRSSRTMPWRIVKRAIEWLNSDEGAAFMDAQVNGAGLSDGLADTELEQDYLGVRGPNHRRGLRSFRESTAGQRAIRSSSNSPIRSGFHGHERTSFRTRTTSTSSKPSASSSAKEHSLKSRPCSLKSINTFVAMESASAGRGAAKRRSIVSFLR